MSTSFGAEYFDGETTAPHPATGQFMPENGILIQWSGGQNFWPLDSISRIAGPEAAGLRLTCEDAPAARLAIKDPAAIASIVADAPRLARAGATRRGKTQALKWIAGGIVGLALLGFGAFEGLPRLAAHTPMAWVAPIGENFRTHIEYAFDATPCASSDTQETLQRLTRRLLVDVQPTASFDPAIVDVRMAQSAIPNALAAPGGQIVVLSGLLDLAGDDAATGGDMLAGVLAHEIAHARLRHPTRALGRALGLDLLVRASGGGIGADGGALIAQFAYGRQAEREADALAQEMLATAGIGDAGLKAFFMKIQATFGDSDAGFLSTHPATAERTAAIPGVKGPERAFTSAEWDALLAECDADD